MSGKSSIGTLLVEYIRRVYEDIDAQFVNLLEWVRAYRNSEHQPPTKRLKKHQPLDNLTQMPKLFEQWWQSRFGEDLNTSLTTKKNNKRRIWIIDEAQSLYPLGQDSIFWVSLKKMQGGNSDKVGVLLLSMYGETPCENGSNLNTPIELRTVLNLTDLRFSEEEVHKFISLWNNLFQGLPIGIDTAKRLWKYTLGHIGFIRLSLEAIRDHFWNEFRSTKNDWDDSIPSKFLLSKHYYSCLSSCRAVPREWSFSKTEKTILDDVLLRDESTTFLSSYSGKYRKSALTLIKRGIIFSVKGTLFLSAPILKMLLVRQLHGETQLSLNRKDIDEFIIETVKRMSPEQLKNSFSVGKDTYLLERQWQMEFYHAAVSVLDRGHLISPDVGTDGWIDFYVDDDFEWGIELLREGYKIGQHVSRFEQGGAYDSLKLRNAVILDFRRASKEPQMRHFDVPIWYIMYEENFEAVTIKRRGEEPISFTLTGNIFPK
eukprot:TRINITY_DN1033_c0_g1_i6.p1 TRINITY_DN1033_c0_g1~~TRINITY_DN1033_c0_g1_i6.p1  ORF type:complete len:485 (-),score=50.37 TRINITY_DN1033_c0_g1_i6:31-1485(-)